MRRLVTYMIAVAVIFSSCSRPAVWEQYVHAEDCAVNGIYLYEMDLGDSLVTYDLSLYTRVDRLPEKISRMEDIPLRMRWQSPGGERFEETVYFPVRHKQRALYRSGFVPKDPGLWKLEIKVCEAIPELRGMGIVLERNGTR